jgi:hypothetical protein
MASAGDLFLARQLPIAGSPASPLGGRWQFHH